MQESESLPFNTNFLYVSYDQGSVLRIEYIHMSEMQMEFTVH